MRDFEVEITGRLDAVAAALRICRELIEESAFRAFLSGRPDSPTERKARP